MFEVLCKCAFQVERERRETSTHTHTHTTKKTIPPTKNRGEVRPNRARVSGSRVRVALTRIFYTTGMHCSHAFDMWGLLWLRGLERQR